MHNVRASSSAGASKRTGVQRQRSKDGGTDFEKRGKIRRKDEEKVDTWSSADKRESIPLLGFGSRIRTLLKRFERDGKEAPTQNTLTLIVIDEMENGGSEPS